MGSAWRWVLGASVLAVLLGGCNRREWRAEFARTSVSVRDPTAPFLKAHLADGGLYVLQDWRIDQAAGEVRGIGLQYDSHRTLVARGPLRVPLADVVLFETNEPRGVFRAGSLAIAIPFVVTGAIALYCALEPKACFGSCPTFYVDDGGEQVIQAEGFSSAVLRSLEETDVDALPRAVAHGGERFVLHVRNEALETQRLESVRLIVVPRTDGRRIARAGERYLPYDDALAPERCAEAELDCAAAVRDDDGVEHRRPAHPRDLGAPSEVMLQLPAGSGSRALLVSGRKSLAETFVFYTLLSWMGSEAARWMAAGERGAIGLGDTEALAREIHGIEVDVRRSGDQTWTHVGRYAEVGPIARDPQLIELPAWATDAPLEVRLRLTRGWWRLDRLASVRLGDAREPIVLDPVEVRRELRRGRPVEGRPADAGALARLLGAGAYLNTYPGDGFAIDYDVPPGEHEVFVQSRGYYLEWIREAWLRDEDPVALAAFLLDPRAGLRRLAPAFHAIEAQMDAVFWRSRFGASELPE